MFTYANVFGILTLVLFGLAVGLIIASFKVQDEPASNETDTSVLTQKNVSGTNIRSNPQSKQGTSEKLLAGGVACACLFILFAFLAFVCLFMRPDSGDQSTDENPSAPQDDVDAVVRGAAERLSTMNRNDQEGIANEPPDVSSSDETAVLFREMLKLDSSSNAEAGGLRLRERRESGKAMTGEDGPSSATMCAASLVISSQGQPSNEADDQEGIAKEPPRVSSSETALSREMLQRDSASNAEAGGSRLPEKRESGKAMTN